MLAFFDTMSAFAQVWNNNLATDVRGSEPETRDMDVSESESDQSSQAWARYNRSSEREWDSSSDRRSRSEDRESRQGGYSRGTSRGPVTLISEEEARKRQKRTENRNRIEQPQVRMHEGPPANEWYHLTAEDILAITAIWPDALPGVEKGVRARELQARYSTLGIDELASFLSDSRLGWYALPPATAQVHAHAIWRAYCEGADLVYATISEKDNTRAYTPGEFPRFPQEKIDEILKDPYRLSYVVLPEGLKDENLKRTNLTAVKPPWGIYSDISSIDDKGILVRFNNQEIYRNKDKTLPSYPFVRFDMNDGLMQLSRLRMRVIPSDKNVCGFCLANTSDGTSWKSVHNALRCPLMMEGRNPAGFRGNPFAFGIMATFYQNAVASRRASVFHQFDDRIEAHLTYTYRAQFADGIGRVLSRDLHDWVRETRCLYEAERRVKIEPTIYRAKGI